MIKERGWKRFVVRFVFIVCGCLFVGSVYGPTVFAMSTDDQYSIQDNTPFYNPKATCNATSAGNDGASTLTINGAGAVQIAQQDSTGTTKVGFALYTSTGALEASYDDTFENYGASITKVMLLVAYLQQTNGTPLSNYAQTNLTGMIEDSNDTDANNVYNLLTNPTSELTDVANQAQMKNFKLNTTGDKVYYLGQSQITAGDFALFFALLNSMIPAQELTFAQNLLSNISPDAGLLQSGLPGTVYSKEGWKPEPGTVNDSARSGSPNPFGLEGAPYIVNQAAQFSSGGVTYGVAVTVGGTNDESTGESIIEAIVAALIQTGNPTTTTGQTCACNSGTTGLTGSDNEDKVWNFLKGIGLTDAQVAGIMGNFEQESSFDPERIQGGGDSQTPSAAGSGGYGLAQWTPGQSIVADANNNDIAGPIYQLLTQLELVEAEMRTTTPTGYVDMLKTWPANAVNSASASASFFDGAFESGTDPNGVRESNAQTILKQYGGTGSTTSTTTTGCSGGQGGGNCSTAVGDAKIYQCALQYKPVSYSESAAGNHLPGGNPAWLKTCPVINASCFLDCSGLVNIAVYDAFGYNLEEDTYSEASDTNLWQHIPFSQIKQGDLIQPAAEAGGHVEIINNVQGTTINTFGAHDPVDGVGPAQYTESPGDLYLHWIGPT